MTEPEYIAVDMTPVTIIKRCEDRACDKYHEWVRFDMRARYFEARVIADAMNGVSTSIHSRSTEEPDADD